MSSSAIRQLKRTQAFIAVSRRGRWTRGPALSVGILPNGSGDTRIGVRTRRGLKGAVVRNRLKRQLRAVIQRRRNDFRRGFDLVVVLHPPALPAATATLETELVTACKHLGVLS